MAKYKEIDRFGSVMSFIADVERMKRGDIWPFKAVTPDHILQTFQGMDNALHAAIQREQHGRKIPPEAVFDKSAITLQILNMRAAMEKEIAYAEVANPENPQLLAMKDLSKAANRCMYTVDEKIAIRIDDQLGDSRYRYADLEERRYEEMLEDPEATAREVAERHLNVTKDAYANLDSLIDLGVSAETRVGKTMNKIYDRAATFVSRNGNTVNTYEQRERNDIIAKNLIEAERDVEVMRKYVLPQMDIKIIEASKYALLEEKRNAETGVKDDYFRNKLKDLIQSRDNAIAILNKIEQDEKNIQRREHDLIKIEKNANQQTWRVSAERVSGLKKQTNPDDKLKDVKLWILKLATKTNMTLKRNCSEHSMQIISGNNSHGTYETNKTKEYTRLGVEAEAGVYSKEGKRGIGIDGEANLIHTERKSRKTTRLSGERRRSNSASIKLADANGSVFVKTLKKRFDAISVNLGLGALSGKFEQKGWHVAAKVSAKIFGAKVEALDDLLSYDFNLGGLSAGADVDKLLLSVYDEMKGKIPEMTNVQEAAENLKQSIEDNVLSAKIDPMSHSASVAWAEGFSQKFNAETKEFETENKFQLWNDMIAGKVSLDVINSWSEQDIYDCIKWLEEKFEVQFEKAPQQEYKPMDEEQLMQEAREQMEIDKDEYDRER